MSVSAVAGAVFAVSLVAYLLTLAPTVTGEDSGELIAAAYTLGIPHPPGYPLWCIVTRVFMLLPVGDIAWRANFGSAVAAAAASALLVPLLVRLGVRAWVAGAGALLLAASSTLWSQAVIAEVYGLSLLLLVGLLYSLVAWRESVDAPDGDRWMTITALLATLSLGAHQTVLIVMPLLLVAGLWIGGGRLLSLGRIARIAGGLLAGLSVQLYLPLRAAAKPAMNWGNPDSFERFWAHVTRKQYPSLMGASHTFAESVGQWKAVAGYLMDQWPWPVTLVVVALALVGVAACLRRDRALAVWLGLWTLVASVGFSWLLNFKLDQEGLHVAQVFFIPAWCAVAMWCAFGAEALAERLGSAAATGLLLLLALTAFFGNASAVSMRGNDVARRYGTDILATLPKGSIVFTSADYEAFPLAYLQIVEGKRQDVAALNEESGVDVALSVAGLAPPIGGRADASDLARLLRESPVPVYSTRVMAVVPGTAVHPVGLLYRTFQNAKTAVEAPALDAAAWKSYSAMPDGSWRDDWSTASILVAYDLAKARSDLAYRGDTKAALALVEKAASRLPGDPVLMNSLGALLVGANLREAALPYYDRALAIRPDYREAQINRITALMALGRWDDAQETYARAIQSGVSLGDAASPIEDALLKEKMARPRLQQLRQAVEANPRSGPLQVQLALALSQLNHFDEAALAFRTALQLDPDSVVAWRGLGMLEAQKGNLDAALEAWNNALRLDPSSPQAQSLRASVRALEARRRTPSP